MSRVRVGPFESEPVPVPGEHLFDLELQLLTTTASIL